MKFDSKLAQDWLKSLEAYLPGLNKVIATAQSNMLLIGAAVFEVYQIQGWIPAPKLKTGDLDISVGLVNGEKDYLILSKTLLSEGYVQDKDHHYRYFSPKKISNQFTYIDLLAHPGKPGTTDQQARTAMGVGPDFSFGAIDFAMKESLQITPKLFCPNPIAMFALKMSSYLDNPKRVKDLGDIAELAHGLTEKGTHFQLENLWSKLKQSDEAQQVKKMLYDLGSDSSTQFDLANAHQDLLKRAFSTSDLDGEVLQRLLEFSKILK